MALNDVKEITIPEGTVKKIEDSNGNIIWGSQSAFPYRRLEYIHFNGVDEYLWPSLTGAKAGYYRSYQFDIERNDVTQVTLGIYDGTLTNNRRRFYALHLMGTNDGTSGVRACIGNTWSSSTAIGDVPLNTKMRCSVVNSITNSVNRMIFNLVRLDTSTTVIANTTINGTSDIVTNSQPILMAQRNLTSSGDSFSYYTKGKFYYLEERATNYQGALTHQKYPVQRKSDGVCGLYDVITGVFSPMHGTTITDDAAGPTVDEYWDLTTPA